MNDRGKIAMIYGCVAVISAAVIGTAMYLGSQVPEQPAPDFSQVGTPKEKVFFPITEDFKGVNQAGTEVKLSDLKGKVWIVTEFLAVCPHCGVRNGKEMTSIYNEFKDHPDFNMVCVSVDPEADTQEMLSDYGKVMEANPANWWFMSHPNDKETHEYLEKKLGFMGVRLRQDPIDRQANGKYAHDMGIMLVDREWNVIGKWPLYDAQSDEAKRRDPEMYDKLKKELMDRIREELDKNETPGIDAMQEEEPPAPLAGESR